MGKIVCMSNCIHRQNGDCKLDYTAITGDMSSVMCIEFADGDANGQAGEDSEEEEPPGWLKCLGPNPLLLCENR